MELSIRNRIVLSAILPVQGKRIEMLLAQGVKSIVEFSAAEITEFELKDHGSGNITWNPLREKDKVVEFSNEQKELIKTCLLALDNEGKITLDLLPVWDKIFNNP